MTSLAPLLKTRQNDYALVVTTSDPDRYGIYGAILTARDFEAHDIDLVPHSDAKNAIVLPPETHMNDVVRAIQAAPKSTTERLVVTTR